ncbi:putative Long chain acyl-CoA synthetase 7; peroxisomal [Paratrimastix pyriformis]|uniref:Long chain acyl-CoA synthetase 7 n=1 Tax=Paratrimastix pyriformis TaxID=342808 RepID=A0ABQ8UL13_9EUKA|nr:putative Long chain acyl-CoA synthetase 7; peroxisomal [Paratrimastix pyriformis]
MLNESPIYNSPFAQNPPISLWDPLIRTPFELIEDAVRRFPTLPSLGQRSRLADGTLGPYVWQSFADVQHIRQQIGSALIQLGCRPRDRIGIFAKTCAYFTIVDWACQAFGFISVPLYATLGPDNIPYVINHSNCRVLFVSQENFPLVQEAAPRCPNLLAVIHFGEVNPSAIPETGARVPLTRLPADDNDHLLETYDPTDPRTFGNGLASEQPHIEPPPAGACGPFRVYNIESFKSWGQEFLAPPQPPRPTDVLSIMYTSGTTGVPKGVILQHGNIIATLAAGVVAGFLKFSSTDIYYAYLPLAHVFERIVELGISHFGGRIGYYSGNTKELVKDINFLKPSLFVGVPRVLNTIYESYKQGVAQMGCMAKCLFHAAFRQRLNQQQQNPTQAVQPTTIYDRLVFRKTRAKLGGNLKFILCGSAPLAPSVQRFLQVVLCAPIQCAYSMTETTLSGAIPKYPDYSTMGHCGQVMASISMKLRDCPEMKYYVNDQPPRGEILVRGPAVFHGYYRDPRLSRQAFTADGWLQTGDIGSMLPTGCLQVVDRIKNIFKLAQGEYVAPEYLETVFKQSLSVAQCYVYGEPSQRFVVALIVPSKQPVLKWVAQNAPHLSKLSWEELLKTPEVNAHVMSQLRDQAKIARLNHFEIPASLALLPCPFPEEFVTPTMKFKRVPLRDHYMPILQALYASPEENTPVDVGHPVVAASPSISPSVCCSPSTVEEKPKSE